MKKTFKEFMSEAQSHVPVVSLDREHSDIKQEHAFEEINKNLAISTSVGFSDMREAVHKIRKILAMYGLKFHNIDNDVMNIKKGTISVPAGHHNTFGETGGKSTSPNQESGDQFMLKIKYELVDGAYDCEAELTMK